VGYTHKGPSPPPLPGSQTASTTRRDGARLEEIPNIGPAIAADLRRLGITSLSELLGRDPYAMYDDLRRLSGQRHDAVAVQEFLSPHWKPGYAVRRQSCPGRFFR
jgi:hypothetical protein